MISIASPLIARGLRPPPIDQTHTVPLGRPSLLTTFPGGKLPGYDLPVPSGRQATLVTPDRLKADHRHRLRGSWYVLIPERSRARVRQRNGPWRSSPYRRPDHLFPRLDELPIS